MAERFCYKRTYRSKKRAEHDLRRIAKQGWIVPANASAYQCPYCLKWHLGHDKYIKYG